MQNVQFGERSQRTHFYRIATTRVEELHLPQYKDPRPTGMDRQASIDTESRFLHDRPISIAQNPLEPDIMATMSRCFCRFSNLLPAFGAHGHSRQRWYQAAQASASTDAGGYLILSAMLKPSGTGLTHFMVSRLVLSNPQVTTWTWN